MRFLLSIICILFLANPVFANPTLDSLLIELDNAIKAEKEYTVQKENLLEKLKEQLRSSNLSREDKYFSYQNLAKDYEAFVCDSAIHYSVKAFTIAKEINNANWIAGSQIQLARSEAKAGLFYKAIDILNTIKRENLNRYQLADYYRAYSDAYIYWIEYQDGHEISELVEKRTLYQDSLLQILDTNTFEYAINYGTRYIEMRDFGNAEKMLFAYLSKVQRDTREYALINSIIAYLYELKGDKEKQKEFLAISAISDIRASVKENVSLRTLAVLLFADGNIKRANGYIKKSLDDANFYNARLRNVQTSKLLPIIDKAYQLDRENQENKLRTLLIIVSVLSFILLVAIFFIAKQMKKLSKAKQQIEQINSRLNELNEALKDVNTQQKQTNISLIEANHIKEQFISSFLEICTEYIEKLDALKITVSRKIKSGQTADLLKLTSQTENSTQELKELYSNFDKAFLNIYPAFVSELNNLLRIEEQYLINKDQSLNQELRIFALIKLGIKDTNKIATFLHYTTRTVYNYRSKVKSKALDQDEDFEEKVKLICSDNF